MWAYLLLAIAGTLAAPASNKTTTPAALAPMQTLNPHDPEDVPTCGEKPMSLREWMNKTRRWDDHQFRQELNFNRGENDCFGSTGRPVGDGAKFAYSDCAPVGIPIPQRACANRTGGENLSFYMTWFLFPEHFTTRQWRSIESVFYHHPQATVVIISNTLEFAMFDALQGMGCRVVVEKVQPKLWAQGTALDEWTNRIDEWKHGPLFFDHLRDATALLLIHARGGVYFEADTIFTNSIYHLHNAIGEGSFDHMAPIPAAARNSTDNGTGVLPPLLTPPPPHLTTSVMVFEKGNPFIEAVMKGFSEWYTTDLSRDAAVGHGYGSWVATRVWNETFAMARSSRDHTVMSPQAFNLIPEGEVAKFFIGSRHELVDSDNEILLSRTYAARLWADETRNVPVMEGSLVYRLLTEFCLLCDKPVK